MDSDNLRKEIDIFKEKMQKVETLVHQVNYENKELQICFTNLVRLINHEVVDCLYSSNEILKNFKVSNN